MNTTIVSIWLPSLSSALGLNLMFLLKSHLLEPYDMYGPPIKKSILCTFFERCPQFKHTKKLLKSISKLCLKIIIIMKSQNQNPGVFFNARCWQHYEEPCKKNFTFFIHCCYSVQVLVILFSLVCLNLTSFHI